MGGEGLCLFMGGSSCFDCGVFVSVSVFVLAILLVLLSVMLTEKVLVFECA